MYFPFMCLLLRAHAKMLFMQSYYCKKNLSRHKNLSLELYYKWIYTRGWVSLCPTHLTMGQDFLTPWLRNNNSIVGVDVESSIWIIFLNLDLLFRLNKEILFHPIKICQPYKISYQVIHPPNCFFEWKKGKDKILYGWQILIEWNSISWFPWKRGSGLHIFHTQGIICGLLCRIISWVICTRDCEVNL